MYKKLIAATVAALFAAAATAGDTFTAMDTDMNGVMSKEEAAVMPGLAEQWEALDADASGDLSAEEYANYESAANPDEGKMEMKDTLPEVK